MISEYVQQAEKFLADTNTQMTIMLAQVQTCPEWGKCEPYIYLRRPSVRTPHNHGKKYIITITRGNQSISFDFWTSMHNTYDKVAKRAQKNGDFDVWEPKGQDLVKPTAYDVLANISGGSNTFIYTFEEWASDYGYDTDSIKAKNTYDACCDVSRKIHRIWNREEIEQLQEIQ